MVVNLFSQWRRGHSGCGMFSARLDLVSLEGKWPRYPPQSLVHAAGIADLLPVRVAAPDRSVSSVAMATLGASAISRRSIIVGSIINIRVDEFLRSMLPSLLEVETTSVAQWLHCV